ncbi:hypothetical protein GCM10011405_19260 [Rufibacter glacialis]|nr:hypothetical protein GCM10011405_19260 [Rufibacter glacialis]
MSCEKEEVEPLLTGTTASDARAISCLNYSYFNKQSGMVDFGKARGEVVLVGFVEGLTMQEKQQLLGRFPHFQGIEGEVAMDSGVITVVRLSTGTNCSDVEKLLVKLVKEPSISFAHPFFEENPADPEAPMTGLSNEFMVSIEGSGTLQELEQFIAETNTKIVFSFSDEIHVLSADKNSAGSILDICTKFNQQAFVTSAEPNLVYSFPALASGGVTYETVKGKNQNAYKRNK